MKRRRKRRTQPVRPPNQVSDPSVSWMRGLAAMGDERWEEAIVTFERFLEMDVVLEDRRAAYYNLGSCYLGLERYDEALVALMQEHHAEPFLDDEVRPKLFIVGERDAWAQVEALRAYVARLKPPKALHILPGADHFRQTVSAFASNTLPGG